METMTKTLEQKTHGLQEKLELAKSLGLIAQVQMIEEEIKRIAFDQKNIYPQVTEEEAQEAMCEKEIHQHKGWKSCRFFTKYRYQHIQENPIYCGKWKAHTHIKFKQQLKKETIGFGQKELSMFGEYTVKESTTMPMAALLRLKEAKDKNFFDSFQIWRPETESEKEARLLDPWLVGIHQGKAYKLCDWR